MSSETNLDDMAEFDALNLNSQETITIQHDTIPVIHAWVQRGNDLECTSCTNPHCAKNAVPAGHMLVAKEGGGLDIVPITQTL